MSVMHLSRFVTLTEDDRGTFLLSRYLVWNAGGGALDSTSSVLWCCYTCGVEVTCGGCTLGGQDGGDCGSPAIGGGASARLKVCDDCMLSLCVTYCWVGHTVLYGITGGGGTLGGQDGRDCGRPAINSGASAGLK